MAEAEKQNFQQQSSSSQENSLNFSSHLQNLTSSQFEQFLQFLAEENHFELLDLSNNQLNDEQFLSILDILVLKHSLKILDVSHNNNTDYANQRMVSKLLLQNMLSQQKSSPLEIIKLVGNPLSEMAMRSLGGVTWIRKELKICVLECFLPCILIDKKKTKEIFFDGTIFLDKDMAYQKAKQIEPHREIVLLKVQIPAHVIDFEREKNILNQAALTIDPQFKPDLIIESQIDCFDAAVHVQDKSNYFGENFTFKHQNCRIALEYLFRSVKHLEHILDDRLSQLDITQDGKQYFLIQFLLGKHETKLDILNIYLINLKISELRQKQVVKEDLIEISRHLFEISNYLKESMENADLLLKEFHEFIENILDNLFIKKETGIQKQKQFRRGVFSR